MPLFWHPRKRPKGNFEDGLIYTLIQLIKETRAMSAASDRLAASVNTLSASVDALVAAIPDPAVSEAVLNSAADSVDALNARVLAATPVAGN